MKGQMMGSQGGRESFSAHIKRVEVGKRCKGKWKIKQSFCYHFLWGRVSVFNSTQQAHSLARAETRKELFIYFLCEG